MKESEFVKMLPLFFCGRKKQMTKEELDLFIEDMKKHYGIEEFDEED